MCACTPYGYGGCVTFDLAGSESESFKQIKLIIAFVLLIYIDVFFLMMCTCVCRAHLCYALLECTLLISKLMYETIECR